MQQRATLLFTTLTLILLFWLSKHLVTYDVQTRAFLFVQQAISQALKHISTSLLPPRCSSVQEYTSFFNNL